MGPGRPCDIDTVFQGALGSQPSEHTGGVGQGARSRTYVDSRRRHRSAIELAHQGARDGRARPGLPLRSLRGRPSQDGMRIGSKSCAGSETQMCPFDLGLSFSFPPRAGATLSQRTPGLCERLSAYEFSSADDHGVENSIFVLYSGKHSRNRRKSRKTTGTASVEKRRKFGRQTRKPVPK
jgi:hypothetical protein